VKLLKSPLTAVLLTVLLIVGYDLASYGANGQSLLLGKGNKAAKITKLKRTTPGPALSLKTRDGSPPFQVNSSGKVEGLHADLLDGLSASDLETRAVTFTLTTAAPGTLRSWPLAISAGEYVVTWQASLSVATDTGDVNCFVRENQTSAFFAGTIQDQDHIFGTLMSGAGRLRVDPSRTYDFVCNSSAGAISVTDPGALTVTFLPLAANNIVEVQSARGGSPGGSD
jgi:hypothetical protein